MEHEQRYLWLFYYTWSSEETRLWWAYFSDWSEVQECMAKLLRKCADLEWQRLEACPHGLKILGQDYTPTCSREQYQQIRRNDQETGYEREKLLFPIAPYDLDYVTSFFNTAGFGRGDMREFVVI